MRKTMELDDCLSARDGLLHVEGVAATQLVERFGSPLFVVSEDQVRRNVRRFRRAFEGGWTAGPVNVLPAVKANWNLAVQRVLADEGCGADVYSAGELEIALRAGIDPAVISVNGVPKSADHIRRTLEVGARLTIDSLEDVRILDEIAPALPRPARVRLRVRPAVSGFVRASDFVPEGPMPADLAALGYKGGLSFDEVIEAGRRVLAMENVELVGFHQHHGRHDPSTDWWTAQMTAYARMLGRVSQALGGFQPKEIDVGGGYAIPRDPHNAATDYTAPYQFGALYALSRILAVFGEAQRYAVVRKLVGVMQSAPNKKPAPSIDAYARAVTSTLLRELPKNGIEPRGVTLELEPGRAIHGNAGVHLCTVRSVKRQRAPVPWNVVTVDTSEFFLTGGRFEHHLHDHVVATQVGAPSALVADVTGRSCYADRLLSAVKLPEVAVGDVFAFLDTGAYQEGSCSNFNAMARPATVLVKGDQAFVIKAAETLDDVLARERVPEHLEARTARGDARAPAGDRERGRQSTLS
jgi:diaminopimelate decarboxylase